MNIFQAIHTEALREVSVMSDVISLLFSQSFLMRALVVGVLVSLCCALLGVSLVLKRFSMIGDGLSHVGFGAMAIACATNVAPLYLSLPIVLFAAFMLLRLNEKGKIKCVRHRGNSVPFHIREKYKTSDADASEVFVLDRNFRSHTAGFDPPA
jgi:hypothetical protein